MILYSTFAYSDSIEKISDTEIKVITITTKEIIYDYDTLIKERDDLVKYANAELQKINDLLEEFKKAE